MKGPSKFTKTFRNTLNRLILMMPYGTIASLLALSASPMFALAQVSFGPVIQVPTPIPPLIIATGDFNGDGNSDLVVGQVQFVDHSQDGFLILLGDGTGSFGAPTLISALGAGPGDILAADFNGDGKLDVAITRPTTTPFGFGNQVDVFWGIGDGTFGSPLRFLTGGSNTYFAAGDVNGDGKLDLAVGSWDAQGVFVHLGNGDGTFGPGTFFPFSGYIVDVALADLNSDGNLDLVVPTSLNTVFVCLGTGTGSFGAATGFPTGSQPQMVAIGDFNNDGKPDLAVPNFGSNNVSILSGTGTGAFGPAANFPTGSGPRGISAADFDGDGDLDLAVNNSASNDVSILVGDGTGNFGPPISLALGSSPCCGMGVGDFNKDGQLDLAVGSQNAPNISIFLNATVKTVAIDIKPGSFPNSINPRSRGTIPVAILSSSTFNAPASIDKASLTFGRTGNEASLAFCNPSPEDVNFDGLLDQVCHFNTQQTGFESGDTVGVLKGKTINNIPIEGTDSVRIIP